jgi:membrane-bound lytic murein transglycosylase F
MGKNIIFVFILFLQFILFSCRESGKKEIDSLRQFKKSNDPILKKILSEGKLVATTDYNSTNYFIYRGEPMGYQYELLKAFTTFLGVRLELVINNDINSIFGCIESEECDLIAMGLTITKERNNVVEFSLPLSQTRQMLVQRKPDEIKIKPITDKHDTVFIRNPLNLSEKTIHIQKNSIFKTRLLSLSDEIGADIHIVEHDLTVEDLIRMVALHEIDYTISGEHIARVNQKYYPIIDVETAISFPQNIAWAVKKEAYGLLDTLNYWLENFKNTTASVHIYKKYFNNTGKTNIAKRAAIAEKKEGMISPYDDIIKKYSQQIGWDWRLLTSLVYQESRFYPDTVAWSGAFGLMQMMPGTAEHYGIDSLSSPEDQIRAGVEFIMALEKQLADKTENEAERTKFVLAAYNVGIAHIYDARRLAEKYNKNPNVWDGNVDYFILNKSKPEYYNDSVVRYGYCRGEETYSFINEIYERFEHYKNLTGQH